jgi:hypothetical protein
MANSSPIESRSSRKRPPLTLERLREALDYDPGTGAFAWRIAKRGINKCDPAGTVIKGYVQIGLDQVFYRAHRLAWLYVYGRWPQGDIDHINGVRGDNRIANLREATHSQNMANRGPQKNNKSGFKGVSQHTQTGKWIAFIKAKSGNSKVRNLGSFDTPEEAHRAYRAAASELFGEFARFS